MSDPILILRLKRPPTQNQFAPRFAAEATAGVHRAGYRDQDGPRPLSRRTTIAVVSLERSLALSPRPGTGRPPHPGRIAVVSVTIAPLDRKTRQHGRHPHARIARL